MPHSGYTICTSEQRLTSTAVSHGFVIERYSSPPFGSHGPCIHSKPCPLDFGIGVPCCNHSLASGGPGAILHNIRKQSRVLPVTQIHSFSHRTSRRGSPFPTCRPFLTGGRFFSPSVAGPRTVPLVLPSNPSTIWVCCLHHALRFLTC